MMRTLSAAELLAAWERGLGMAPSSQALLLLTAAGVDTSPEDLARLSIGHRDARLLALRRSVFGPILACLAVCAGCGERLELEFDTTELLGAGWQEAPLPENAAKLTLHLDGVQVDFRLPNSLDLLALDGMDNVGSARSVLLERCVLAVSSSRSGPLPETLAQAVAQAMEQADPQANISATLACPSCGRQWQAGLNVVAFFLEELEAWVTRLLSEVHTLASAYGWQEADILALSPWRRQFYLERVSV